jgi:hypothetical protein
MNDDKKDHVNGRKQGSQNESAEISERLARNDDGHETNKQCTGSNELATGASGKPVVSLRKVEANRRNALKSTGPRTPTGKGIVARNALTHGFFSKWLLVHHPDGQETQAEYDELRAAIWEHYEPVGFLEELLAEKILVCCWRLRRLIRSESGHISKALAEHDHDRESRATAEQPALAASTNREDSMTDHLFLPANEDADKLLRYEAMIYKQLNHAIAELERLQARRKGEPVRDNFAKQSQQAP